MIFVLFGATGIVGDLTTEFFKKRGIRPIAKKSCILDESRIQRSRINGELYSREEVERCAFHYEISGRLIGFEFRDINDAGNGKTDVYMTLSTFDKNILCSLHNAYGQKVKIIYVRIDPKTLESITNARADLDAVKKADRIENGKKLRGFYFDNSKHFDNVVIYDETDGADIAKKHLLSQYESIVLDALEQQNRIDNGSDVFLPYNGNDDYAFVSYSHDDRNMVQALLFGLKNRGCKIWYDKGLEDQRTDSSPVDTLWEQTLQDRIKDCSQFLVFRSKNSVKKPWVWEEFNWAIEYEKPITVIHLDDQSFGREKYDYYERFQSPSYRDDIDFVENIHNHIVESIKTTNLPKAEGE